MEHDKIFKAIESIIGRQIVCFHTEANRYAFKLITPLFGRYWYTLNSKIVDDFAVKIHIK